MSLRARWPPLVASPATPTMIPPLLLHRCGCSGLLVNTVNMPAASRLTVSAATAAPTTSLLLAALGRDRETPLPSPFCPRLTGFMPMSPSVATSLSLDSGRRGDPDESSREHGEQQQRGYTRDVPAHPFHGLLCG